MKEEREVKISFWAAHFTTMVSVTLLLLIVGVIALMSTAARNEATRLKERVEVSVVLNDSASDAQAREIALKIRQKPYSINPRVITKQQAMETWKKDTGESLDSIFGVNPLSPEVAFSVKASHASPECLSMISSELGKEPAVEAVVTPDSSMIDAMNSNIELLTLVLGCVALVLIIISFVLINNTVHLTVYSRRFSIHTMQLVGATNGFIRRPFVRDNMFAGALAGVFATVVLGLVLIAFPYTAGFDIVGLIGWQMFGCIAFALIVLGAVLCAFAAFVSTSGYLRKDYEQLFG